MRYSKMLQMIQKVLKESSEVNIDFCMSTEAANQIELWSKMYENHPPWKSKVGDIAGLPPAVAAEHARLITLELKTECKGSPRAEYMNKI